MTSEDARRRMRIDDDDDEMRQVPAGDDRRLATGVSPWKPARNMQEPPPGAADRIDDEDDSETRTGSCTSKAT
ncbi:MAG: hypothetical protein HQ592_11260 [Planctomycetes bacterium]|nr:hypothetical protein [Planctomycetota bacterium]